MSRKYKRYPNDLRQYAIRLSHLPHADLSKIANQLEIPSWQMKEWLDEQAATLTRRQECRFETTVFCERYGNLLIDLMLIMRRHDTEELISNGAPDDEYEPEARRVLRHLHKVKNAADMRQLVKSVFLEMFDEALYGTDERLFALADDIWMHIEERS